MANVLANNVQFDVTSVGFRQRLEELPPAGARPKEGASTTAECFKPLHGGQEAPPKEILKYRRSDREPGARFIHPGLADDYKDVDPNKTFGNPANGASDDSWRTKRSTEVNDMLLEAREKIYATNKREPLGCSYSRGFALPEFEHVYGKPARPLGGNKEADQGGHLAKAAVYPGPAPGETDEAAYRHQYIVSHHAYDVGQQKRRGYVWPAGLAKEAGAAEEKSGDGSGADLDEAHQFGVGVGSKTALNNNSANIKAQFSQHASSGQGVSSQRLENYRGLRDEIGRCRNTGMGSKLPEAHVFGATARRGGDWDARACIEGEYSHAAQQPDQDLGCSMTPGFRKDPAILAESNANIRQRGGSHGLEHVFGLPNIRSDLPPKHFKSIADSQNYGDDVTANYLLYPPNSAVLGAEDADFTAQRTKRDVFSIFKTVTENGVRARHVPGREWGPGALGNTLGTGRGDAPATLLSGEGSGDPSVLNGIMEEAWLWALGKRQQSGAPPPRPPYPGAGETLSIVEFRNAFNKILDREEQKC